MNYKIIQNDEKFRSFIDWLPELEKGEMYYGCLFARMKYDTTGVVKSDKTQLKRFTSNKEFLYQKVKQLETALGTYTHDGNPIPQEALALYIMPNPRSLKKANIQTMKDIADLIGKEDYTRNPQKIALTNMQKYASRKIYLEFDFDTKIIDEQIEIKNEIFLNILNTNCLRFLQTKGGFHVLVEVDKIGEQYTKTWYRKMTSIKECDVRGDILSPVVGCTQGGFVPHF